MTRTVLASLLVLVTSANVSQTVADQHPNTLTPAERAAGWRLLFDGKTLDGWRAFKSTAEADTLSREICAKRFTLEHESIVAHAGSTTS